MGKLKKLLLIMICTLAIPVSYGRDRGFAIECTPLNNDIKQILSFFETGIDKRVRYWKLVLKQCGIGANGELVMSL